MSNTFGPPQTTFIDSSKSIWAGEPPKLTESGYYNDSPPVSSTQNSVNASPYVTTQIKADTLRSMDSKANDSVFTKVKYVLQHPLQSLTHLVQWVVAQVTSWFAPKSSADKTSDKPSLSEQPLHLLNNPGMYREALQELAEKQKGCVRQAKQRPDRKEAFKMDPKAEVWMNGIRKACGFWGAPTNARKRVYACAYTLLPENKKDDQELINLSQKFGKTKSRSPLPESMRPKESSEVVQSEVEATKERLQELYKTIHIKDGNNEVSEETEKLFNRFKPDIEVETLAEFILFTKNRLLA